MINNIQFLYNLPAIHFRMKHNRKKDVLRLFIYNYNIHFFTTYPLYINFRMRHYTEKERRAEIINFT